MKEHNPKKKQKRTHFTPISLKWQETYKVLFNKLWCNKCSCHCYPHLKADFQHMPVSNEAAVLWAKALVGVIDFCISLDSLKYRSMRGKGGWPFSSPQTVNSLTNPYSRLIMVSNINFIVMARFSSVRFRFSLCNISPVRVQFRFKLVRTRNT